MALSSGEKCGYIYAVAVDESCRGFGAGAALTRAAADAARGLGAEIICTLPAEASLYPWYEKLISTRFTLCRCRGIIPAGDARGFDMLSAAEYNARREALLADTPHLTVNDAGAELLRLLCEAYGGGCSPWTAASRRISRRRLLPDTRAYLPGRPARRKRRGAREAARRGQSGAVLPRSQRQ